MIKQLSTTLPKKAVYSPLISSTLLTPACLCQSQEGTAQIIVVEIMSAVVGISLQKKYNDQ